MKALSQIDGARTTRVEKPPGGSDDSIDSFVISAYFFVEDKRGFKVYRWDDVKSRKPSRIIDRVKKRRRDL